MYIVIIGQKVDMNFKITNKATGAEYYSKDVVYKLNAFCIWSRASTLVVFEGASGKLFVILLALFSGA